MTSLSSLHYIRQAHSHEELDSLDRIMHMSDSEALQEVQSIYLAHMLRNGGGHACSSVSSLYSSAAPSLTPNSSQTLKQKVTPTTTTATAAAVASPTPAEPQFVYRSNKRPSKAKKQAAAETTSSKKSMWTKVKRAIV